MKHEFTRVTPESVGIPSSAVLRFLDQVKTLGIDLHSMMLLRHGKVCAEGWWEPFAPQYKHPMYSFSKSLTSTAVGFAVQEGLMSLSDRLVDIFPDKLPETVSEHLQKATIHDLLIMGCGHETEPMAAPGEDWSKTFLAHEFKYEPGTMFQYNTAGTNLLVAALRRKTGQNLTEFLRPRLFDKIGIGETEMSTLPDGTEAGGAGYKLRTEDMARFITFVANQGVWEGERLLNQEWFERATSLQIETKNEVYQNISPDWLCGYCYQYWRCQPEGVFRADGLFGQFGLVMTKQDAILILTATTTRTQELLQSVWDILLPAMAGGMLPNDPASYAILQYRLGHLQMDGCQTGPFAAMRATADNTTGTRDGLPVPRFTGQCYHAVQGASLNLEGLATFSFAPASSMPVYETLRLEEKVTADNAYPDLLLTAESTSGALTLSIGMNGSFLTSSIHSVPYGAAGRWRSSNLLEVTVYGLESVLGARYLFRFGGSQLHVTQDPIPPAEASALAVLFEADGRNVP